MQIFLIVVIGLALFVLVNWYEVRRLKILESSERKRTERENALWKMREARDKIDVSLLQRMENAVGALRSLIEEQKRYTWEAAKQAASLVPTLTPEAMAAHQAAFDAAGIYHDRQGVPRAGSEFPFGAKVLRPELAPRLRAETHYDEADVAAARQRDIYQAFMDAQLTGVGAFQVYHDTGGIPRTEHISAAAFMAGGGSFDGGGASGDYDRGSSSTSIASDSCSSSSASASSDTSSSSCSSSDSGGSSYSSD